MEKVVITGLGVVSPIGNGVEDFAASLFAGRHGITHVDRFDTSDMSVRLCAPVKDLDTTAYFSPSQVRRLDQYSVYGLIAAKQAIQDAGLRDSIDPFRLSVYMSTALGGVGTLLDESRTLSEQGPRKVSPMLVPKWTPNILSGLVAIDTGARGAAMSHSAACASSATSIGEGVRTIRHGYADAVICGGAEALIQKLPMAGFQNLRALSTTADPDRASIPFDRERSGFIMGEGGAALVLERESHARARGAAIYAEVSGYGVTCDAFHVTAPAEDGVAIDRAITDALAEAGERLEQVYVNAHGTSTVKNDRVEAAAIERRFGERAMVSATKSATGHMLGASGAVEAIASVLAIRRGTIPPTVGTERLDDDMRIDLVRGRARPAEVSRAVSLSLGFGGHNVCLVFDKVAG